MTGLSRKAHDIAANKYVAFFGSLASILAFGWYVYDKFSPSGATVLQLILFCVGLVIVFAIGIYSIRVRQENRALRDCLIVIHKINHHYRDVLSEMFGGERPISDRNVLARKELQTLQSVCHHISRIFCAFTHCDCMVTVKFITVEEDGRHFCETHARSETDCERDRDSGHTYEVKTGANTTFDTAIQFQGSGRISHFFHPDLVTLKKQGLYRNQRDNWEAFYHSALVVPIRYVDPSKIGTNKASDDIGFLCVDTMSEYRLNDGFHLQLLASFADQTYNFMSLMRGKYRVQIQNQNC